MNRKLRYGIILLGFLVFLILAPLLVFYIRGIKYNTQNNSYVETGIISIQTDPKNASIYLDNEIKDTTPTSIRFLDAKEYLVRLEKKDYQPWEKKLTVKAGKVTWANDDINAITLFLKNPIPVKINDTATDVSIAQNSVYGISGNLLITTPKEDPTQSENNALPEPAVKFADIDPDVPFLIIQGTKHWIIFDKSSNLSTSIDLPLSSETSWYASSNGSVFALDHTDLYSVLWREKITKKIASNIDAFALSGSQAYLVTKKELTTIPITGLGTGTGTILAKILSDFAKITLFTTSQKEIFLLGDNNLYKVNSELEKIAERVNGVTLDKNDQTIIIATTSELFYYDWENNETKLITRFTKTPQSVQLDLKTGYAFIASGTSITALELNNRDRQNTFLIYEGNKPDNLIINNTAESSFFLDQGKIILIKMR